MDRAVSPTASVASETAVVIPNCRSAENTATGAPFVELPLSDERRNHDLAIFVGCSKTRLFVRGGPFINAASPVNS